MRYKGTHHLIGGKMACLSSLVWCLAFLNKHKFFTDVQNDFRVHAEKEMQGFFQLVKYKRCDRALQQAINKMVNYFVRLRTSATHFVHKELVHLPTLNEGFGIKEEEMLLICHRCIYMYIQKAFFILQPFLNQQTFQLSYKSLHQWQYSRKAFLYYVPTLTDEGYCNTVETLVVSKQG